MPDAPILCRVLSLMILQQSRISFPCSSHPPLAPKHSHVTSLLVPNAPPPALRPLSSHRGLVVTHLAVLACEQQQPKELERAFAALQSFSL